MVYCHFALRNTAMFRKVANMNGLYTISNPNTATTNEFNSDYNSFSDVEYFEVFDVIFLHISPLLPPGLLPADLHQVL